MSDIFDNEIGELWSAAKTAKKLCIDVKTVRKYADSLGGKRVGRLWKFPERSIIDALLRKDAGLLVWPVLCERPEIQIDQNRQYQNQKGSLGVGSSHKGSGVKSATDIDDPYGYLT